MNHEKIKQRALTPLARNLEAVIALHTNIDQELLNAITEALDKAYSAGVRNARAN